MTYNVKIDLLLNTLETLSNTDDIWDPLLKYLTSSGVDAMSYYHLTPPGVMNSHEQLYLAWGFNEDAVAEHRRKHMTTQNPLKDRSRAITEPVFWSKIFETIHVCESTRIHLKDLYFKDHTNGIVIPVHGPNARSGVFVLRFLQANRRYSRQEIRCLQWASQYAHQTFCKLHAKTRKQPTSLTPREKEILTWVARGKSNTVIADIVGISQHTVNGYLRRIYLKTGTSDRTTASLRGIGEALINY